MGAIIDPNCALCYWGIALSLGPNYNMPMRADVAPTILDALRRAEALDVSAATSPVAHALIAALSARYEPSTPPEPAVRVLSTQYAAKMREVAAAFPHDDDVQVLAAESVMDVRPWKLWMADGVPADGTEWVVSTLETVLQRNPTHPGANHYYIHAVEASKRPEKALASADRLPALVPGAGHIIHMPAHIYQRLGRYADASRVNEKAIEADVAYFHSVSPPGMYSMYLAHNYGFLSFSASMEGRSAIALQAARRSAEAIPPSMLDAMPGMDFFAAEPLLAMVRFGRWDELLAEPRPDAKRPVLIAFWLHGLGMAFASKGRLREADAALHELRGIATTASATLQIGQSPASVVYSLAATILAARIATLRHERGALGLWDEAVRLSDSLDYSEPDDWYYSVRTFQGAALLADGRATEAEAVYRRDLVDHPNSGWALFGLGQALAAEGSNEEASHVQHAFRSAWRNADIELRASAF
jgi:tetratricopeptide (TPR) repeat protein